MGKDCPPKCPYCAEDRHRARAANQAAASADKRVNEALARAGEGRKSRDASPSSPYVRHYRGGTLDVYRICELWGVTHPARVHALKKVLCAGVRGGGKSEQRDIEEAIVALQRWCEMQEEEG